ncbi:MAG TPA: 30S ribosomal protein S9 [Candidatus Paceibacterota bacterium]
MTDKIKYFEAIGRRKTARARVRLYPTTTSLSFEINGKKLEEYFGTGEMLALVKNVISASNKFKVSGHLLGGGIHSQAEALRHGIARALCKIDPRSKVTIKKTGALTRDSRSKERRKFGLKKARKAPKWSKR